MKGADLTCSEYHTGLTPLMLACHLNKEEDAVAIAKLLLHHSSNQDLDTGDIASNTALHHAAMANKLALCKLLIEKKASTDKVNKDGLKAIDLTN